MAAEVLHGGTEIAVVFHVKVGRNLIPQEPLRLKIQELNSESFHAAYQAAEKHMVVMQQQIDEQAAENAPAPAEIATEAKAE